MALLNNQRLIKSILDDEEVLISRVEENSNKNFGITILDKLIRKESLIEPEFKWIESNISMVEVDKKQLKSLIKNLKYNNISLN